MTSSHPHLYKGKKKKKNLGEDKRHAPSVLISRPRTGIESKFLGEIGSLTAPEFLADMDGIRMEYLKSCVT